MALNELNRKKAEKILVQFCEEKVPKHVRNQYRLSFKFLGNSVNLIEERPHYKDKDTWMSHIVAQFRYEQETNLWSVYWKRHTGKWLMYDEIIPNSNFEEVLKEVDEDKLGIFWG